jgi:hypothetical protein
METTTLDYGHYFKKGISFEQYHLDFEKSLDLGDQVFNYQYLPLNWQRSSRILKQFQVNFGILEVIEKIENPVRWLLISEHWCGDASQIVPVLSKIAEASNGKIELRMVYRDQHLPLIDAHLTNGGRSIPKLIQLNEQMEFEKEWGPRPVAAQEMVIRLKSDPETAPRYSEELHKWYAMDKQQSIVSEIIAFLND